jgi:hypothetical protein
MDTILTEFRQGLRRLWRDKGFSLAVILTLALGVGANGAIFAALDAYLLRPSPESCAARFSALCRISPLARSPRCDSIWASMLGGHRRSRRC